MINNLSHVCTFALETTSNALTSAISKRWKTIAVIALAIISLISLAWIYREASLSDHSVDPIDPSEDDDEISSPSQSSDLAKKVKKQNPILGHVDETGEAEEAESQDGISDAPNKITRDKFDAWLLQAAKDYPTQYKKGSHALVMKAYDTSYDRAEFFGIIDSIKKAGHLAGPSAFFIKKQFDDLTAFQKSSQTQPMDDSEYDSPESSTENSPSARKSEKQSPFQHKRIDKREETERVAHVGLSDAPANPFRDEFENWLWKAYNHYATEYQDGSYATIMNSFDTSHNRIEFFGKIDALKVGGHFTGPSAFNIKKQVDKLWSKHFQPPGEHALDVEEDVSQAKSGFLKWDSAVLDIVASGLNLNCAFDAFPVINDSTRFGVRDATIKRVSAFFSLKPQDFEKKVGSIVKGIPPSGTETPVIDFSQNLVKLCIPYNDRTSHISSSKQLLGRFDVLAMLCTMDYDYLWNENPAGQRSFFIHHAAAINIGENSKADDFIEYSLPDGRLDKQAYLKDMGKIFHQMLAAQQVCGAEDVVWFPFGMGAFLRNLAKLDPSYNNPQLMGDLRQEIAEEFTKAATKFPTLRIHMCLPLDHKPGSETQQNYNAFVRAFSNNPELHHRSSFYINADATDLAQKLANQNYKVSLANGTNRNLIGNHWFKNGARTAIEENLDRRSFNTALTALLLNGGIEVRDREPDELAKRIKQFKGECLYV